MAGALSQTGSVGVGTFRVGYPEIWITTRSSSRAANMPARGQFSMLKLTPRAAGVDASLVIQTSTLPLREALPLTYEEPWDYALA